MSRSRAAVLEAVEHADGLLSMTELSETTGLHANTLRAHLEALTGADLVRRERAAPEGRGRPAWLYRATSRGRTPITEYAGLATTLAATIHRTSDDPTSDAVAAGTDWGHELARTAGRPDGDDDDAARRQVVALLDDMGFDPQVATDAEHSAVRLRQCPLLDAARRYPDVVCGVHLGIAKGALQEYDADDSQVSLLPFADPESSLLHLTASARDA